MPCKDRHMKGRQPREDGGGDRGYGRAGATKSWRSSGRTSHRGFPGSTAGIQNCERTNFWWFKPSSSLQFVNTRNLILQSHWLPFPCLHFPLNWPVKEEKTSSPWYFYKLDNITGRKYNIFWTVLNSIFVSKLKREYSTPKYRSSQVMPAPPTSAAPAACNSAVL